MKVSSVSWGGRVASDRDLVCPQFPRHHGQYKLHINQSLYLISTLHFSSVNSCHLSHLIFTIHRVYWIYCFGTIPD